MKQVDIYAAIRGFLDVKAASQPATESPSRSAVKQLAARHKMATMPTPLFLCFAQHVAEEALRRSKSPQDVADSVPANPRPVRSAHRSKLKLAGPKLFMRLCVDTLAELDARLPKLKTKIADPSEQDSEDVDRMSDISRISALSHYLADDTDNAVESVNGSNDEALRSALNQLSDLEMVNMAMEAKLQASLQKTEEWEKRYAELETFQKSNDHTTEVESLKQEIEALKVQLESAKISESSSTSQDLQTAKEELELLKVQLNEAKSLENELRESLKTSKEELEVLNAELEASKSQLSPSSDTKENGALNAEIVSLKEEIVQLKKRLEDVQTSTLEESGVVNDGAENVSLVEELRSQLDGAVASQKAAEESLKALELKLDTKEAEIVALKAKNEEIAAAIQLQSTVAAGAGVSTPPRKDRVTSLTPPASVSGEVSTSETRKSVITSGGQTPSRTSQTSSTLQQLRSSGNTSAANSEIQNLVNQYRGHVDSLLSAVRSAASANVKRDPPTILLPLKQILLVCRQLSEMANLPPSWDDAETIERKQAALDKTKASMSESLSSLMEVTKKFAFASPGVNVVDVVGEAGVVNASVRAIHEMVKSAASDVPPPAAIGEGSSYVETTRAGIQLQTTNTVQTIQSLLQVLRTVTNENLVSVVNGSIIPKILAIATAIDGLISSSDTSILQHAKLFGCTLERVEEVVVALDAAKGVLEEMGGTLVSSGNGGLGEDDSRVVKHKVGTASYAIVKSMKDFCDVIGV